MIERLELKNILSFGPGAPPIELRPLNVLIGPNGSGKSNLLDVIALLRSLPKSLTEFFIRNGPAADWSRAQTTSAAENASIRVAISASNWQGTYCIELSTFAERSASGFVWKEDISGNDHKTGTPRMICERSELEAKYFRNGVALDISEAMFESEDALSSSILSLVRDPGRYPGLSRLVKELSAIDLYRDLPYGRNHRARKSQTTEFLSGRLKEDGSNLNQVLLSLRKNSATRKEILEALAELNPAITEFNVDVQANQSLLYIEEDGHPVPASRISDGLLRMLCLMAILLDPDAKGTICLEEPEVGLHPDAILLLAKMLKEASSRCQVIVTTHSEVLVDCFSDEPESIVVCERENGSTTMRRLEAEPLKKWLEEYSLAQLWSKGVLGGNRW